MTTHYNIIDMSRMRELFCKHDDSRSVVRLLFRENKAKFGESKITAIEIFRTSKQSRILQTMFCICAGIHSIKSYVENN